jgi:hypothetical protein
MANYKKASVTVLANATGTQTLTDNGSGTKLLWTEVADQTNNGSTASHMTNSVFTAPYAGFYHIGVSMYYGSTVTLTAQYVTVVKNGSFAGGIILMSGSVAAGAVQNASRVFKLAKDDTIAIYGTQTSGASQIPDAVNTVLSIVRVGNAS